MNNLWASVLTALIMSLAAPYWGLTETVSWRSRILMACVIILLAGGLGWYDGHWKPLNDGFVGLWTVVAYVDAKERIIPNRFVLLTMLWGIMVTPWTLHIAIQDLATGLGLFAFYLLVHFVTSGGLGMGDVKFSGAQGFVLGWPQGLLASVVGLWAAGLYSLILLMVFRRSRGQAIALGPFLVLGGLTGLVGLLH